MPHSNVCFRPHNLLGRPCTWDYFLTHNINIHMINSSIKILHICLENFALSFLLFDHISFNIWPFFLRNIWPSYNLLFISFYFTVILDVYSSHFLFWMWESITIFFFDGCISIFLFTKQIKKVFYFLFIFGQYCKL
jgi:hypothetical protein